VLAIRWSTVAPILFCLAGAFFIDAFSLPDSQPPTANTPGDPHP
jgi:hypothetical protein